MIGSVAIVGASAAGVAAATTLRDEGYEGEITLIGGETDLPYERPAVSKDILLTGAAPPIIPEQRYAELNIKLLLGTRAERIDARYGQIELSDGRTMVSDRLLLATGGWPRRLPVPGAELGGLHYVRDARDGQAIRSGLRPGARIAVVGGGLIGAEVAASAVQAGCEVDWIEAEGLCLARALSRPLAEAMMDVHRQRGVRVHANALVVRLIGERSVQAVELADGRRIDADMVVVGIGITPAAELAEEADLTVSDGIVIDPFCRTSAENVYAAGDVARHQTRYMATPSRLEHWRNAQEQGVTAARAMLGHRQPYDELPWFWTDQYDLHIEGCGVMRADDETILRGNLADGNATVFHLRAGSLVGACALNRQGDVRGAMRLITRGLTPSADILSDPTKDLRKIEKELSRASA
ncbi:NAD(P)/FAD-dependent oxidoreductase [Sphingomonas sp. IC081]|uniref:Initial dioxygenase reductase subunit n=1 Tax=Sphingomonas sp. CB3 TaxID=76582 RepID=O85286_9SPHN|nr:FAD-dependent oxidoreductase [Sphingomonas sp. IC081]AAC38619.1 initial dioxygenase reductase subunit [Sphingomonas sp. CB3]QDK35717.1 pyridine nucleotide-disulfide oxidoreductase [Sphingomonas sp. IC081]